MAYSVISGEVLNGVLYLVAGSQSVVYNTVTYAAGQTFRGVAGVNTFTFSGVGAQELNEMCELKSPRIEYIEDGNDVPNFADITVLKAFGIEYELNEAEKIVNETTVINDFGLELIDYPFYAFEITETRL